MHRNARPFVLPGLLLAAGFLLPSVAEAGSGYVYRGPVNTYAGRTYFNPATGRVVQSGVVYNRFTGRTVYQRGFYNPYTGRTGGVRSVYNPRVGVYRYGVYRR
jgi:hypothetical protein